MDPGSVPPDSPAPCLSHQPKPLVTCAIELARDQRFQQPPGVQLLAEQHTELRVALSFTTLFKDMIEGTDERPDEEYNG